MSEEIEDTGVRITGTMNYGLVEPPKIAIEPDLYRCTENGREQLRKELEILYKDRDLMNAQFGHRDVREILLSMRNVMNNILKLEIATREAELHVLELYRSE